MFELKKPFDRQAVPREVDIAAVACLLMHVYDAQNIDERFRCDKERGVLILLIDHGSKPFYSASFTKGSPAAPFRISCSRQPEGIANFSGAMGPLITIWDK